MGVSAGEIPVTLQPCAPSARPAQRHHVLYDCSLPCGMQGAKGVGRGAGAVIGGAAASARRVPLRRDWRYAGKDPHD
eukprot:scaffold11100_cov137-Isochrysis_galbana.AAC.1